MKVKLFAIASSVGCLLGSTALAAGTHTYLIGLSDAPLVEHAHAQLGAGLTSRPMDRQAMRRQLASSDSLDYASTLAAHREQTLGAASAVVGRPLRARHVMQTTNNAVAVDLTDDEATRVATIAGVTTVRRERVLHVLTDAGPQWIGANALWNGQVTGVAATKGEGTVIGIVDTGINPTHPSFAATGGDGYTNVNPRGHYYGLCATGDATCTPKLIGIYDMTDEGTKGVDSVGHGSHVSGIAAGNAITDSLNGMTTSLSRNVSGVAPHANLIMYKACTLKDGDGTCAESDLVAAIDQAVADGVDVINYSIGGDSIDPYQLLDDPTTDAYAFFQARQAGVVNAVAAGNDGPGAKSIDEPGNAPWVIGVANATHNRTFRNTLGDFSGAANAPATLVGQGFTSGYGPAAIVYAGDYGNALCGIGDSEGVSPTGKSNPFPAGTFHGQIVICDRGIYARVEKGYNVKAGGAGGFILANAQTDGESIISDDHFLPAVHLGFDEGALLKTWVATSGTHNGAISGVAAVLNDADGDVLSSSSSRGPYGFSGGVLKPDITAPGSNILSADGSSSGLALLTGTSMATPHVAGSAALVIAVHPTWTPDQIESALMGTALASIRKEDGVTPATALDAGSGKVQPATAVRAGLYLPLSAADFRAQDPSHGGDLSKLNRVGIESENCQGICTFTRTVRDLSGGGTWMASATASAHAIVAITPAQFTLAAGGSQTVTISVNVADPALPGTWTDGRILLHKSTGGQSAADTVLPLAVYSSPGTAPPLQDIAAPHPSGDAQFSVSGLVALPNPVFTATSLQPASITNLSLGVDANPNDIYTTLPAAGKQFVLFPMAPLIDSDSQSYSQQLVVEVTSSTATTTRLYAGIDSNGDGLPEYAEQACATSGAGATTLRCVVDLRGSSAANAWALVEIPQGSGTNAVTLSGGVTRVTYASAAASQRPQAFQVIGPGHTNANDTFPLRVFWGADEAAPPLLANTTYYGSVLIDATGDTSVDVPGRVAAIPIRLTRGAGGDDIVDPLQPASMRMRQLVPTESLSHQFVDVSGNGTLDVTTALDATTVSTSGLSFYAVRTDFPASSSSPEIAAAPAANGSSTTWTITSAAPSKSVAIAVTPGRWYIVASNRDAAQPIVFSQQSQLTLTAPTAPSGPGSYYNPARSGHGIFVSEILTAQVSFWYTFLEDGTPVWYQAQGNTVAAGGSAWTAPLLHVVWNGSQASYTIVGEAAVTPIDADDLMYSWRLYGTGGSERFARLTGNECVSLNGSAVSLAGQWFAPAQPGYGMDVAVLPSLQFDAFYLYDALGQPRWVVGSNGPFAASMTQSMQQATGFCPVCDYVTRTLANVGTLNVAFTDPTHGSYQTNITLAPPLSGSWTIDQPITRITGSATCSP